MEIRRVQITGGSSFFITLPKDWAIAQNIKKNDPLGIIINSNGRLLITTQLKGDELQQTKNIDIGNISDEESLFRLLIGAYITGFDNIELTSKERMNPSVRTVIRKFTTMTIGQEVVEETDTSIFVKDLLDPSEMPFNRTLKRMHIIVKSMLEDSIRAIENNDIDLSQDVISRDNDVDRLHWLVARQYNIILRNTSLAEKLETTMEKSSTCFLISRIIERIGDHVVQISQNSMKIININIDKKILNKIVSTSNFASNIFSNSVNSFFRKDIESSNKNIASVKELRFYSEEINTMVLEQNRDIAIAIGHIVDSIKRIAEYAGDISEQVINYLTSEEK